MRQNKEGITSRYRGNVQRSTDVLGKNNRCQDAGECARAVDTPRTTMVNDYRRLRCSTLNVFARQSAQCKSRFCQWAVVSLCLSPRQYHNSLYPPSPSTYPHSLPPLLAPSFASLDNDSPAQSPTRTELRRRSTARGTPYRCRPVRV